MTKKTKKPIAAITTQVKVLRLNTWFRLPDDFKGDMTDALLALVAYRRGLKLTKPARRDGSAPRAYTKAEQQEHARGWKEFVVSLTRGFRHVGRVSVDTVDFTGAEWAGYLAATSTRAAKAYGRRRLKV